MEKFSDDQISLYLDRIGLPEDARQDPPSMQQLHALVTAHQATIPFENLSREWLLRHRCLSNAASLAHAACLQFLCAAAQR